MGNCRRVEEKRSKPVISWQRKAEITLSLRSFAGLVLRREADGAEMPSPKSDEEDEFMRETLRTLADEIELKR